MARNPPDDNRRQSIEWEGDDIWIGGAAWPKPAACFTSDIQQTILDATGLPLCVPHDMQPAFWEQVAECCITFAQNLQVDLMPQPSAENVRAVRSLAARLNAKLPVFLGIAPGLRMVLLHVLLLDLVKHLDTDVKPRSTKPKRTAGRIFIPKMSHLFTDAFKHPASEAPDGYFARFVLACLVKTEGLPETLSGEWVQRYVRENNRQKRAAQ